MGTLLIGYDLDKPDQDYSDLIAAIKNLERGGTTSTAPGL